MGSLKSVYKANIFEYFQTGPWGGAHQTSYAMDDMFLYREWRPGRGVNHPPPSSTEVKERIEPYLYSPSGPSWRVPL